MCPLLPPPSVQRGRCYTDCANQRWCPKRLATRRATTTDRRGHVVRAVDPACGPLGLADDSNEPRGGKQSLQPQRGGIAHDGSTSDPRVSPYPDRYNQASNIYFIR